MGGRNPPMSRALHLLLVVLAGTLWSFGGLIVRYMEAAQTYQWQYLFFRGMTVALVLTLFMAAGYTIEQAVCCATVNGADLLKMPDRGRIAPGMPVLWAVVPGDESRLPSSLHQAAVYTGTG